MFHLPATSARLSVPGPVVEVVEVVEAVDDAIALEVSTAAFSFLAHPARTATQEQIAMRVVRWSVTIEPPVSVYGRLSLGVVSSQPNVRRGGVRGKSEGSPRRGRGRRFGDPPPV